MPLLLREVQVGSAGRSGNRLPGVYKGRRCGREMTSGKYWLVDVIISTNPRIKRRELKAMAKLAAVSEATFGGFEGVRIPPRTFSFAFATKNDAIR